MRNVTDKFIEKIKNHNFMFNNYTKNLAIYETMWKNIVEPNRHHMTIGCMIIAC